MIPYLCGGTFLTQVLRVTKRTTTPTDHTNGKKESLSEQEVFRRLLSIYKLHDFDCGAGKTLKTYTNRFKSCEKSLQTYTGFTDSDCRQKFDADIRSGKSKALYMMSEFVKDFINVEENGEQVVRCLLGMIKNDETVPLEDELCSLQGYGSITRQDITKSNIFYIDIEPFLLGVWHYIIMNRAEKNEAGQDTYREWYPSRATYRGNVGSDITMPIKVMSANVEEPVETEETFEGQEFTARVEQERDVNNYVEITIKNNIQGNTIQNLTLY